MDRSLPGSFVHGILQARILEWIAMLFSRESSQPRDGTCISYTSCIASGFFTTSATWEAHICMYLYTFSQEYLKVEVYNIFFTCFFMTGMMTFIGTPYFSFYFLFPCPIYFSLCFLFFFIFFFFFSLQYCIGFAMHQHESTTSVHMFPILNPPSHLPPHTIPLGHPSAPDPSILYHALTLVWQFISHMILYMFEWYSPKSSHPRPLPQRPKDCSIHLCIFCCLTYRVIITIFLNSIYMH